MKRYRVTHVTIYEVDANGPEQAIDNVNWHLIWWSDASYVNRSNVKTVGHKTDTEQVNE